MVRMSSSNSPMSVSSSHGLMSRMTFDFATTFPFFFCRFFGVVLGHSRRFDLFGFVVVFIIVAEKIDVIVILFFLSSNWCGGLLDFWRCSFDPWEGVEIA